MVVALPWLSWYISVMIIGINPSLAKEAFFPGEGPWPRISPKQEASSLWSAAGSGDAVWYDRPDDLLWGNWSSLLIVDDVPFSQFDGIVAHLRRGEVLPDRAACIALSGRRFHGQRNRAWSVERGNLHLVVHFTPNRPLKKIGHGFTLLPAVAAVRAIRCLSDGAVNAGMKWVNDIVVNHHKVGGIIVSTQTKNGIVEDVVLGLGINIDAVPEVTATPFVPTVSCLRDLHAGYSLTTLLPAILSELQELYDRLLTDGFLPLMKVYREYSVSIGQEVRIWPETASVSVDELRKVSPLARGVVTALADDLSLIIEDHPDPVTRGRLAEEDACRQFGL